MRINIVYIFMFMCVYVCVCETLKRGDKLWDRIEIAFEGRQQERSKLNLVLSY